jgi:hypothetical protein
LARRRCGTHWRWHGNAEACGSIDYITRHCCDIYTGVIYILVWYIHCCDIYTVVIYILLWYIHCCDIYTVVIYIQLWYIHCCDIYTIVLYIFCCDIYTVVIYIRNVVILIVHLLVTNQIQNNFYFTWNTCGVSSKIRKGSDDSIDWGWYWVWNKLEWWCGFDSPV